MYEDRTKTRKGGDHPQGKQLSNIYSTDICYEVVY